MPELPEVETIREGLRRRLLRTSITKAQVTKSKIIRGDAKKLVRILKGAHFVDISRRGKLLIFHINKKGNYMLVHLKMTGQLIYEKGKTLIAGGHSFPLVQDPLPNKYSHLIISFTNGARLFFNDMRQFGYVELAQEKRLQQALSLYGPEPLEKGFTLAVFEKALGKRATSIKAALLNQHIIAGIGNIYADESCFMAGIKPSRKVNTLTTKEKEALWKAIPVVLKKAIAYGGTTFSHYRDADGKNGNFTRLLQVYGRGGKPCLRCGTALLKRKIAARGTVYCPSCQK